MPRKTSLQFKKRVWIILFLIVIPLILGWGAYGHERINRAAVMALPSPLLEFFYNHIDFVTQESSVPDLRKYTLRDKAEHPRHYIDLENFGILDSIPLTMKEAKIKFSDSFLDSNGILPWYLMESMEKLTRAFKEKRKTEILFLAADIGHYLGDANMPLHTSANHDGQLTNQRGIHAFWEAQLPEMFGSDYNFYTGEAKYIENIQSETWDIILRSHRLADTLLMIDRELKKSFSPDSILVKSADGKLSKNKFNQVIHTLNYAKQYHLKANGMIERQLRSAIRSTSNFWYTAWINAGKPDLSELDPKELTERNRKNLKDELSLWKKGKLFGIQSETDF
ncbi:S1/P1 Nuclease [bacterium]|nr:S1/P1 Nuclease [bacterium]